MDIDWRKRISVMPFFSQAVAASKSVEAAGIVTDQLQWMVDPKTTGNLNDLVGSINGTLTNGAYIDAENSVILDGVNDYVNFGNQTGTSAVGLYGLSNFTICVWHYSLSQTSFPRIISKGSSAGDGWAFAHQEALRFWTNNSTTYAPATYSMGWRLYGGALYAGWLFDVIRVDLNDSTNYPRDVRFTSMNGTYNTISSLNDIAADTNGNSILIQNATHRFSVGGTTNGRYSNSKFGAAMIYHKTLTNAEIQQNFNAMKSSYGL